MELENGHQLLNALNDLVVSSPARSVASYSDHIHITGLGPSQELGPLGNLSASTIPVDILAGVTNDLASSSHGPTAEAHIQFDGVVLEQV